jgi:hypothetical protein
MKNTYKVTKDFLDDLANHKQHSIFPEKKSLAFMNHRKENPIYERVKKLHPEPRIRLNINKNNYNIIGNSPVPVYQDPLVEKYAFGNANSNHASFFSYDRGKERYNKVSVSMLMCDSISMRMKRIN